MSAPSPASSTARGDADAARPSGVPHVSVIVCSIDPAKFARVSANYALRLAGIDHEIVGIHDARSLAEGYNRGVARARGGIVVFSHDDVEHLRPSFGRDLVSSLQVADVVGAAGTARCVDAFWMAAGHPTLQGSCVFPAEGGVSPPGRPKGEHRSAQREDGPVSLAVYGVDAPLVGGIQSLDGMFMAARREVLDRVPFDEATFDGFHGYDADWSFRAHKAGLRVAVDNRLLILHRSTGRYGPEWLEYRNRFLRKHFGAVTAPPPRRPVCIQSPFARVEDVVAAWDLPTLIDLTRQLRARAAQRPPA